MQALLRRRRADEGEATLLAHDIADRPFEIANARFRDMRPRKNLSVLGRTADLASLAVYRIAKNQGFISRYCLSCLPGSSRQSNTCSRTTLQIREALAEHAAVIGFPKKIALAAIGDLGHLRREIFEAPDVFFRDAIHLVEDDRKLVRRNMDQDVVGEDDVEESILERNVVSRGLDNIDAGHGRFRFLDAIALHLDAAERREPGALQRAQHQADIAADLEKARVFRNGLEPFLNELIAPFAITAQAGLVDLLLAQRIPVGIIPAEIALPYG